MVKDFLTKHIEQKDLEKKDVPEVITVLIQTLRKHARRVGHASKEASADADEDEDEEQDVDEENFEDEVLDESDTEGSEDSQMDFQEENGNEDECILLSRMNTRLKMKWAAWK